MRENGNIVWDVSTITVTSDKDRATNFTVYRRPHPSPSLDDSFQRAWRDISERRYPYNEVAYFDHDRTIVDDVCLGNLKPEQLSDAPVLYTLSYATGGDVDKEGVEAKLKGFKDLLTIGEY